jgi:hypothetical protein
MMKAYEPPECQKHFSSHQKPVRDDVVVNSKSSRSVQPVQYQQRDGRREQAGSRSSLGDGNKGFPFCLRPVGFKSRGAFTMNVTRRTVLAATTVAAAASILGRRDTASQGPPISASISGEHAYYLDYENRKPEHIKAVTNDIVNWKVVAERVAAG